MSRHLVEAGVGAHVRVALRLLRTAQRLRSSPSRAARAAERPVRVAYRLYALHLVGMDLPVGTTIGEGLVVHHGVGLVVHEGTRIGDGVVLRHNTTVGAKPGGRAPTIGDRVDVGANCVVLGDIALGDGCVVGAGSVVVRDVAAGDVVAGNPAVPLRSRPRPTAPS